MFYSGSDQMEAAMLRGILLFNGKITDSKRQNMIQKAVLSIVIYGGGSTKQSDIERILDERFNVDYRQLDIQQIINQLHTKDLVEINKDGTIVAKDVKGEDDFFKQLNDETHVLIDSVIERITKQSRVLLNESDKNKLPNNIWKALSSYYSMYGYKYFRVSKNPDTEKMRDAIECAVDGLNKNVGQAVVRALADLIADPSENELRILEKWARAYVAMQAMNLDPMLRNFKQTKISQKSFVIDTDVALHAITTHAKHSKDYRLMIDQLKAARCKMFIPDRVVDEISDHIDAAWKWYGSFGPQLIDFTDEILDSKIGNVFIEDYVKQIRLDPQITDFPFKTYLENFRSEEFPTLTWDCLKEVFGEGVQDNPLRMENLDDNEKEKLKSKVLEQTMTTAKGIHRSDEKNEDVAELDAMLYLTLMKMNKNEDGDERPLGKRIYLLTGSDRTNRCAKEIDIYQKDICCNPQSLIAIMQETGSLNGSKVRIINLFENPFLVYAAEEIWNEVEPLLNNGARLKYVELRKLRLDVDAHIDRILTCKTQEERVIEAQRQLDRGYLFAKELVEADQLIKERDTTIALKDTLLEKKDEEIAKLKAQIERKRKEKRKEDYLERISRQHPNRKKGK